MTRSTTLRMTLTLAIMLPGVLLLTGGAEDGTRLRLDVPDNRAWFHRSGTPNIYFNDEHRGELGDVAIGVMDPTAKLHVDAPGSLTGPLTKDTYSALKLTAGIQALLLHGSGQMESVDGDLRVNQMSGNAVSLGGDLSVAQDLDASGDLTVGGQTTVGDLDVTGSAEFTGTLAADVLTCNELQVSGQTTTGILTIVGGADLAEPFDVTGDQPVEPGTVLAIDAERAGELRVADRPYDTAVAGVVSGAGGVASGLTLRQTGTNADGEHPVALSGRVWVRCDATLGAIRPGDLLTTSSTAGHAMKAGDPTRAQGAVLGKAMSALESGTGLVLVLVGLQ